MKIGKCFQIDLAVCDDATRFHIASAHLDTGKKVAVATNGLMLARVPVEIEEGDTSGPLTVPALKAARKASRKGCKPQIKANGSLDVPGAGVHFLRPKDVAFPSMDRVIPEYRRASDGERLGGETIVSLSLDAGLLLDLARAIGVDGDRVVLTFPATKTGLGAIVVEPASDNGAIGVLMPCRK